MGVPALALAVSPSANDTFALVRALARSAWALSPVSWADTSSPPSSQRPTTASPHTRLLCIASSSLRLAWWSRMSCPPLLHTDLCRLPVRESDQADTHGPP